MIDDLSLKRVYHAPAQPVVSLPTPTHPTAIEYLLFQLQEIK